MILHSNPYLALFCICASEVTYRSTLTWCVGVCCVADTEYVRTSSMLQVVSGVIKEN